MVAIAVSWHLHAAEGPPDKHLSLLSSNQRSPQRLLAGEGFLFASFNSMDLFQLMR